jgi:protein transport protein SEC61 subunit gamma-like protein
MIDLAKLVTSFISSSKRILIVSRKPDKKEFSTMCKITGIGIIIIAAVGFVITFVFKLLGLGV